MITKTEKVVAITSRLERWHTAYELDGLAVSVSSHGRINVAVDGRDISLSLVDSVDMLGRVSEMFEKLADL